MPVLDQQAHQQVQKEPGNEENQSAPAAPSNAVAQGILRHVGEIGSMRQPELLWKCTNERAIQTKRGLFEGHREGSALSVRRFARAAFSRSSRRPISAVSTRPPNDVSR